MTNRSTTSLAISSASFRSSPHVAVVDRQQHRAVDQEDPDQRGGRIAASLCSAFSKKASTCSTL
jgi:hypothetical protein